MQNATLVMQGCDQMCTWIPPRNIIYYLRHSLLCLWQLNASMQTAAACAMCGCRDAVKRAQAQLETFQQGAPPYPKTLFKGKGIVIMAGGLTYFVPAWINIHMLRKTGMPQV